VIAILKKTSVALDGNPEQNQYNVIIKKLCGLSPLANYTDPATVAFRRS
jgi:hypothetical protein